MSEYIYYIKKIYKSSPQVLILEIGDKRGWPIFNFTPGQYALISYRNKNGRFKDKQAFSLASSPENKQYLRFGIKIGGSFTQGLANLKEGEEILISGPYGNFTFDEKKHHDLVMIAGGIGITPFFSTLAYVNDKKLNNNLTLLYSAKNIKEATFYEDIKTIQANNSNIKAFFSLSADNEQYSDKNIINNRFDLLTINKFIPDIRGKTFFICGPVLFNGAMINNLLNLGVDKSQIETEGFSMIPDAGFTTRFKAISYALAFVSVLFFIPFGLINYTNSQEKNKKYDYDLTNRVNQAVYDHLSFIYENKNLAVANLNNKVLSSSPSLAEANISPKNQENSIKLTSGSNLNNTPKAVMNVKAETKPLVSANPVNPVAPTPTINVVPVTTPTPLNPISPVVVVNTPPKASSTPPTQVSSTVTKPAPKPAPVPVTKVS